MTTIEATHGRYRVAAQKHLTRAAFQARTRQIWLESGLPEPVALYARRLELGFTKADVARFVDCTEQTVGRWERGLRVPTGLRLRRYLRLLRLTPTGQTDSSPLADLPAASGNEAGNGSTIRCSAGTNGDGDE